MEDSNRTMTDLKNLYIVTISIHGLLRGSNLELGRDADTGGQTKYVVELARSLAQRPEIDRVDLITRRIQDPKVSADYAQPIEPLSPKSQIVRLSAGPRRYLRKEVLWPHLDIFADEVLRYLRTVGRTPDLIHSHYADAGYVGSRVAGWLGVPLVHTGHSLGRVKLQRMLEQGSKPAALEEQFHFNTRIEAEEVTLASASLIVASTQQEVQEQYQVYDNYQPDRMVVIPPGTELQQFYPPPAQWPTPPIQTQLDRFLTEPQKPMILALSRAERRKNVASLVQAYGESPELQSLANLVLVLGSRTDIAAMEPGPRQVMTELMLLIDRYDLYGKVAYPKQHQSTDVADLYRLATQTRGVFINPALTEPFGLTLIEAAASGLPVVATNDGGPRDILAACANGQLVDPLNLDQIRSALYQALTQPDRWQQWSEQGLAGVRRTFSWEAHTEKYLQQIRQLLQPKALHVGSALSVTTPAHRQRREVSTNPLIRAEHLFISDIDNTLIGDREGLDQLLAQLLVDDRAIGFGVATGRTLPSALETLQDWQIPLPDVLITAVGSEIHYGPDLVPDTRWRQYISHNWQPNAIRNALNDMEGLVLQPAANQRSHKISYWIDPQIAPQVRQIRQYLRRQGLNVRLISSHGQYLDILPWRASKGDALRYCALKWGFLIKNLLVAGDSGNDVSMLRGNTRAVVVGNHSRELDRLRTHPNIYFAGGHYAWGILEGLAHYQIPGFGDQPPSPLVYPSLITRFGSSSIAGDRPGSPKQSTLQRALS